MPDQNLKWFLTSKQNNSGKNTEINKQSHDKFWFNRKNMELSHIYLAVKTVQIVHPTFRGRTKLVHNISPQM